MSPSKHKMRELSWRLRLVASGLRAAIACTVLAGVASSLVAPQALGGYIVSQMGFPVPPEFSIATLMLMSLPVIGQAALLFLALSALDRAFAGIARSDNLSVEVGQAMSRAGAFFLCSAMLSFLARPLISLFLSIDLPAGSRFIAVTIGTTELFAILVSGVLVLVGHLIVVATELEDENRQFI